MNKKMRQKKNKHYSRPEKSILNQSPFASTEKAPWLVFFSHGKGGKTHTICSMGDHNIFVRRIPQMDHKKCTKNFTLINPVSMESIDLPPIPPLPQLYRSQERFHGKWSFQMTAPPTDESSIIILGFPLIQYVIFCYPCDEKKWFMRKCVVDNNDDAFLSIAVVNGNIYGYTSQGRLAQLHFNHCNFTIKCPELPAAYELYCGDAIYMVESSGNLYMVQINRIRSTHAAKCFIVYKMNFHDMMWEETKDIGQNRVFLVDWFSEGVSCSADEAVGLQGNCIYYINHDNHLYEYNLDDKSITMLSCFPRHRLPDNCYSRWLLPLPQSKDLTNMDGCKEISKNQNLQGCHIDNSFTTSSKLPYQEISVSNSNTSKGEENRWPNLLPDLVLELIQNHLSYLDTRCALLAIPEWMSAIDTTAKPIGMWYQDSPCLLTFSSDYKTCILMDPFRDARHLIQSSGLPSKVRIMSAKHGWLLLRGPTKDIVFFYNPLSKAVIKLPQPPEIFPCHLRLSFSTPPTSSNCVVVAEYISHDFIQILVCRRGENEWTQLIRDHNLEENDEELRVVCPTTAVFLKQRFHWLGTNGVVLGVLDLTTGLWEVKRTLKFEKLPETYRNYLLESEDELFRVWAAKTGDCVRVYKLDYSTLAWHKVESLGDRCFFLLQTTSISATVALLGNEGGRIYFLMLQNGEMVYYSYRTQWMLPSDTFYEAKEFLVTSCWIQPSWVQHSSEELQWC